MDKMINVCDSRLKKLTSESYCKKVSQQKKKSVKEMVK